MMSLLADLKILYHLALRPVRGKSHAERLSSFYDQQAQGYDDFRKRLLQGRQEMIASLPDAQGGLWIDMGGGTGANLEFYGSRLKDLRKVYVVDLAKSLLDVCNRRVADQKWTNISTALADATTFVPPEGAGQADLVTFSYSLTMIPDWFAALDQARRLLKPGGVIGVVDFHVSRKYPADGHTRHSTLTRHFWPWWFAMDNVHPNADHVPYLHRAFDVMSFSEHRAKVPYLPLGRVPYYRFLGRRREEN